MRELVAHAVRPGDVWSIGPVDLAAAAAILVPGIAVGAVLARRGGPMGRRRALLAAAGAAVLVVALAGPLEALATTLLSAHMLQHALLVSVGAPLLAVAVPPRLLPALLPGRVRHRLPRMRAAGWWPHAAAVAIVAIVLWAWHVPALYEAAVGSSWVHALEHTTMVGAAVAFWWAVLGARGSVAPSGVGLLVLVIGTAQATALAALIGFASRPLYPVYAEGARLWGLERLADQQMGAFAMWGIGGLAAVVAAGVMTVTWLERSARRYPDAGGRSSFRTSAP